jgi:predicted transcriptional regulator
MCYKALRIKHKGSVMPDSTFTFRVDEALKNAFTAAAKANDLNGAQVLREVMRDYVAEEALAKEPGYDEWLSAKLDKAIAQAGAGMLIPSDEVEEYFAKLRGDWPETADMKRAA